MHLDTKECVYKNKLDFNEINCKETSEKTKHKYKQWLGIVNKTELEKREFMTSGRSKLFLSICTCHFFRLHCTCHVYICIFSACSVFPGKAPVQRTYHWRLHQHACCIHGYAKGSQHWQSCHKNLNKIRANAHSSKSIPLIKKKKKITQISEGFINSSFYQIELFRDAQRCSSYWYHHTAPS